MKSIFLLALAFGLASAVPTVDEKVLADIAANGKATVLLHFKGDQSSDVISTFHEVHRPLERSVHHDVLPNMLIENANKAQAKTLEFFAARAQSKASSGTKTFQLWMINRLVVEDADLALIEELKSNDEITHIEADREEQLIEAVMDRVEEEETTDEPHLIDSQQNKNNVEWGVDRVGAPKVWGIGHNGSGVTVGIVDTGVYAGHETLKDNIRRDYNFFDAVLGRNSSYDDQGHGTHCAGTVLGTKGIGVAPGARWIACKGLNSVGSGTTTGLNKCMQFMLCPTLPDGTKRDCSKAPQVVSNSWGSTSSHKNYDQAVNALIAQGITVVFANGNSGDKCETTGSPADNLKVIAVGATNINNVATSFTSRGPTKSGEMRPDVAAPGDKIRSAYYMYPTQYRSLSGTSMACPHVAGIAALYISADRSLKHDQVKQFLMQGAQLTKATGQTCGPEGKKVPDSQRPNHVVGFGLVNATKAFAAFQ